MKIILDAMGGDLAPEAPVLGAIDAAKDFGAEITLVGRSEEILEVMRKNGYNDLPKGVEIAGADAVVVGRAVFGQDDPIAAARRIEKIGNDCLAECGRA